MATFYEHAGLNTRLPYPTLLGSGIARLPHLTTSGLETFVFSWTLKASDGNDLEAEIDAHTFEYFVVDPTTAAILKTYTVAGGTLSITSSSGVFIIGGSEFLTPGRYVHILLGTHSSTGYKTVFFDGTLSTMKGPA